MSALAEIFGIPAGAIRVRLLRARRALRERLDRFGPEGPFPAADDRMSAALSDPDPEA